MTGLRLVRATGLAELYEKSGWSSEEEAMLDRRLAEFISRNLRGSDYEGAGYGSVDEILAGDLEMIRRFTRMPGSDVHLCAVLDQQEIRAFMLWYSLQVGGNDLLPPGDRKEQAMLGGIGRREIAYGDWLIVDSSCRTGGLGGLLFAVLLNDMARGGYSFWYGRTVVPANLGLYERLYLRKGRAQLIGRWQDGAVTRIGFLGDLRGGWTEELLRDSLKEQPHLLPLL